MIEEIHPHIFRIGVPLPHNPLKLLNSYLVRGVQRNLLIDTGFRMEECRQALTSALVQLGANMQTTDIFLTHLHADHTGLAPELATAETQVFFSATDIAYLQKFEQEFGGERYIERLRRKGFSAGELAQATTKNPAHAYAPPPFNRFSPVQHNTTLHYGGYTLRCVATPGHTPGHTCLYVEQDKLMFLGDHVLFDITPNITDWDGCENILGAYLQSLDKIAAYNIAVPLPAHRGVKGTVHTRVQQLKQHHQQRLQGLREIVHKQPGLSAYAIAGHMPWSITCNSWQEFPLQQKWFAVGEAAAHLDYLLAEGLICREYDGNHDIYLPIDNEK